MHPIERFKPPRGITAGQPLKDLFDAKLVELIGESFAAVHSAFDRRRFAKVSCSRLDGGTMLERAGYIADGLEGELPADFVAASAILTSSLGPLLVEVDGEGLRGFFYMPHSMFIARHAAHHFDAGMAVNYELTRRFTAEFSVRPWILRHQSRALTRLKSWTKDADPNVRRLCSEGTRPRLPWASRLPALQADPALAEPILEALKDDPALYVRRSVANHLGDVCKDHPGWAYALCQRWLDELSGAPAALSKERKWLIRHALRLPAKKGDKTALSLRKAAK